MSHAVSHPLPSVTNGLAGYLVEIRKFPLLTPEEESIYARRWRSEGDRDAAYHLVTSHLRLVAKIACDIVAMACHLRTSFPREMSA